MPEVLYDVFFNAGDIGLYDEDKHFFIVDRLKELIKVKGIQVNIVVVSFETNPEIFLRIYLMHDAVGGTIIVPHSHCLEPFSLSRN